MFVRFPGVASVALRQPRLEYATPIGVVVVSGVLFFSDTTRPV